MLVLLLFTATAEGEEEAAPGCGSFGAIKSGMRRICLARVPWLLLPPSVTNDANSDEKLASFAVKIRLSSDFDFLISLFL